MPTILKLPDSTIQMIAAGEVITSPYNVIKELLENSLDAGATNIRILIEGGGMKTIEIIDNGCGVRKDDAYLLCKRHATSKLSNADDLTRISTFGFRGEALASISEMADVEVESFNKDVDNMGWTAKYFKGAVIEPIISKYTQNVGTHIKVTNLFLYDSYRSNALQSTVNEEKKSVVELVKRYAIHHRDKVTISLKDICPNKSQDLICLLAPTDIKSCFGMFFGIDFEKNIIEANLINNEQFKADAYIIISYKKSTITSQQSNFILFVNNRLVECSTLKKDLEALTHEYLSPKMYSLAYYIALKVPPADVDVNMHPAKSTVALHFQEAIISLIIKTIRSKFDESQYSSQLSTPSKTLIPLILSSSQKSNSTIVNHKNNHNKPNNNNNNTKNDKNNFSSPVTSKRPHDLVHNDYSQRSLKQFITADQLLISNNTKRMNPSRPDSPLLIPPERPRRELNLKAIKDLRQLVAQEMVKDGIQTIKNSVFVGIFDHERALIQHETILYAINLKNYLKEQLYQFYLFDFGNFPPIEILQPGNKIKFILDVYLEDLQKHDLTNYEKLTYKTAQSVIDKLLQHTSMFEDYLSLKMTNTEILTIPCVMPDEIPNLAYLGKFLSDLANHVNYKEERECYRHMGRVVADFYSEPPANLKDINVHRSYHEIVENKLYEAIKNYLIIPDWLYTKENICQISDTKDLYKVFERC